MQYILLLLIPTFLLIVLGIFSRPEKASTSPSNQDFMGKGIQDSIKQWTRAELQEKLKVLGQTPVPEDSITFGAMCYSVAVRETGHHKTSFVCPVCGSSTIYSEDDPTYDQILYLIPTCEARIKEIKGLELQLDLTRYCSKCNKLNEPSIGLKVRYHDEREDITTYGITGEDLQIIQEFLAGRLTHKTSNDGTRPLMDHIARLEVLLGIKID